MNENVETYLIPNNFIDEGRVFNGAIRTRYLVEAIVMFLIIALPCWILIPKTVEAKFGIVLGCSLPLAMFALVGINGDSFSGFLKNAWKWRKERQIMLFNDHARTYQARPVDVMLSEVYASDVLINSLDKWRAQRAQQNANIGNLVENVDFIFMKDEEYEKMTPQDIREKRKQQQKEAKKAQKNAKKKKTESKNAVLPALKAADKKPELGLNPSSESELQPEPKLETESEPQSQAETDREEKMKSVVTVSLEKSAEIQTKEPIQTSIETSIDAPEKKSEKMPERAWEETLEDASKEEGFIFVDEPLMDEDAIESVFIDTENANVTPEITPESFVFFEEDSVSEDDIIRSFSEIDSSIDEPLILADIVASDKVTCEIEPAEQEEKTPATVPNESPKRHRKRTRSKGGVSK